MNGRIFFITILILLISCASREDKETYTYQDDILVRIADKTITVNEFLRRAEYTIRPAWCRDSNPIHKKIVLNSLIAEKLLALEQNQQNELMMNPRFQKYLTGRKEQAMRQWLYQKEIDEQIHLDSNEVKKVYHVAGREYELSYLTVGNQYLAKTIKNELLNGSRSLEDIFHELGGEGELPSKVVTFKESGNDSIRKALYSDVLSRGQYLGPITVEGEKYTIIRIDKWTEKLALSDKQAKEQMNLVQEKLKERYGIRAFQHYIRTLMKGKSAEFNKEIFAQLAEAYASFYQNIGKEKENFFKREIFDDKKERAVHMDFYGKIETILDKPLVTFDGKIWTVREFRDAEASHPLVFRKDRFEGDYAQQFKYAIIDLIRDQYVTKDAYKKKYDQVPQVQEVYNMWKDNMLALFAKDKYLHSIGVSGGKPLDLIEKYLNDYIAQLQQKYSDRIEIDTDKFNELQLNRIDMYVIQKNVPYPDVVPSFPELTSLHLLNYGKKLIGKKLDSVYGSNMKKTIAR